MRKWLAVCAAVIAVLFTFATTVKAAEAGPTRPRCYEEMTYNVTNTTGNLGCEGLYPGIKTTWLFTSDVSRQFVLSIDFRLARSWFTVYYGDHVIGTFSASNYAWYFSLPDGEVTKIEFYSGDLDSTYWCALNYKEGVVRKTTHLNSGQTYNLDKVQPAGGFIYFTLPYYSFGSLFSLEANIYAYQGIREPDVFVSVNDFPTLEHFDYTNKTIRRGDKEQMILYETNPRSGVYFIGVFFYGSAARMEITATWSFNVTKLNPGIQMSDATSQVEYYQTFVPRNTKQLRIQFSRGVPGGNPIAYIAQGILPSPSHYQYKADTTSQSYIDINITDPNPASNPYANPGNYIIAATATNRQYCGFIVVCNW